MQAQHSLQSWLAAVLALCALQGCGRRDAAKAPVPLVPVLVIEAQTRDVPVAREWIGSLDGSENADIRARVSGYLLGRDYQEGAMVRKGDRLFELDARPFEVALAEARSELDQGKALQLASQAEADRSLELFRKKVISEKEFINKTQLNKSNVSKVQALEAAVEQAKLNVQFCKILSPVDGIVGVAKAQVGDLVGTATGPVLTSVSTLDPIKLIFPISEAEYLLASERMQANLRQPLKERPEFIELLLADGKPFGHKARLLSVDLEVNQATGTILVTALLKNPGSLLRPGQFARARVIARTLVDAVVVPQRAVAEVQGSYQLGIVDASGNAEIRPVTVGVRDGSDWVISAGLRAGEKVIVEGLQNVKAGMAVEAKPWIEPAGWESPTAARSGELPVAKH